MSLNNLGGRLSALGRREDALAASEEAVDIRRHLAAADPSAFLPDLAGSLEQLDRRACSLPRPGRGARRTPRRRSRSNAAWPAGPTPLLPDLAASLNNLGGPHSPPWAGARKKRYTPLSRRWSIRRRLAAAGPMPCPTWP